MAETLEFQANAGNVFDVLSRMQTELNRLETSGGVSSGNGAADRIGESFLRSERVVSRSAANMVTGLIQANDAGQALATSLLSVEHAGKLGLGLAVGIAVGIAGYEAIAKVIKEAKKADDDLANALSHPLSQQIKLDAAGIEKEESITQAAVTEKTTQSQSFGAALVNTYEGAFQNIISPGSGGSFGSKGVEADQAKIEAGEKRLDQLDAARGKSLLAIADAKRLSLEQSEKEGTILKINAEYEAKRAAAVLAAQARVQAGGSATGITDEIRALKEEKETLEIKIREKGFFSDQDLSAAEAVANFRGTPEEKKDFTLQRDLTRDQNELNYAKSIKDTTEAKKLQLKVDQDLAAIEDNKIAKAARDITSAADFREGRIAVDTARGAVGLGPEATQRSQLEAEVKIAQDRVKAADQLLEKEGQTKSAIDGQTKAIAAEQIALAKLDKFNNEKAFSDGQALAAAKLGTAELLLQSQGQGFLASLLKDRETAEQKIAALLRDQKTELAGQALLQGQLALRNDLKKELFKTPQEAARQAEDARETQITDARIKQAEQDIANGARLDATDPVAKYLAQRDQLSADVGAKKGEGDFSSLNSLSGADFSSLASLSNMNFSGLSPLSGLTISIA